MPGAPVTQGCSVLLSPGAAGPPDSGVIVKLNPPAVSAGGIPLAKLGDTCLLVNSATGAAYQLPITGAGGSAGVRIDGHPLLRVGDQVVLASGATLTVVGPPAVPYIRDNWSP